MGKPTIKAARPIDTKNSIKNILERVKIVADDMAASSSRRATPGERTAAADPAKKSK